jgi:hypothetical protein
MIPNQPTIQPVNQFSSQLNLPVNLFNHNSIPRTSSCTLPAKDTFGGHVRILLLKHDIMGTDFNTCQATRAGILIHEKYAVIRIDCILRTVFRTNTTLVAKMDAVVSRFRESSFNSEERLSRVDLAKIFDRACQSTGAAAGTITMNGV